MLLNSTQVWRLVTHHLAFLTSSELMLGGLLLYSFRLFERRYGTSKFAAFVVSVSALGTLFQVAILTLAAHWYENREATIAGMGINPVPFGYLDLCAGYRTWAFD